MSKIPRAEVAEIIVKKSGKVSERQLSREVAAYLLDQGQSGSLSSLLRDVQNVRAEHGFVEVIATSAHALTPGIKNEIKAKVRQVFPEAKTILITEEFNPEIIGGVRIDMPGHQLDLSLRTKLNKLKNLTSGKD